MYIGDCCLVWHEKYFCLTLVRNTRALDATTNLAEIYMYLSNAALSFLIVLASRFLQPEVSFPVTPFCYHLEAINREDLNKL